MTSLPLLLLLLLPLLLLLVFAACNSKHGATGPWLLSMPEERVQG